ncbi:uncharacterized protein METZ01_LOCUS209392, partial [marine metagenome]
VTIARPFLKWAGGKHRVVSELLKITNEFSPLGCDWKVGVGSRYHEPFLGSGAMYFGMKDEGIISTRKDSYLSDLNPALINVMQVVSDAKLLESLIRILGNWQNQYGKKGPVPKNSSQVLRDKGMYYKKRRQMNQYLGRMELESDKFRIEFAALMIFLNKTCFNGLWRMNSQGLFNVPEGDYVTPQNICQEELLRSCNQLLKGTKIERMDWKDSIKRSKPGDLVYLDPPYMPLKIDDQVFNSYYTDGFDFEDQRELALAAAAAASRGVRVIASNHDALGEPTIRDIYGNSAADV